MQSESKGENNSMANKSLHHMSELPLEFLCEITNDFSEERIISDSAFATVYKVIFLPSTIHVSYLFCHMLMREVKQGILHSGKEIAVKRYGGSYQATPYNVFRNEIGNLMEVEHENILRLIGFCCERRRKVVKHDGRYILTDEVESYLCHEYIQCERLDKYIYGTSDTTTFF